MSEIIVRNGYVYETRVSSRFVIVFLWNMRFGLLSVGRHAEGWPLTAPVFQCTHTGLWQFKERHLRRWLMAAGARRLKEYLHVVPEEHAGWV